MLEKGGEMQSYIRQSSVPISSDQVSQHPLHFSWAQTHCQSEAWVSETMDPATAAAFASLRAAIQQAQQVNSQPRAPPPRVERDIVLLEFVPPAPQQKVNKYQKLTPQGLDRQFFVSRSKATRASIGKDIADVYLAVCHAFETFRSLPCPLCPMVHYTHYVVSYLMRGDMLDNLTAVIPNSPLLVQTTTFPRTHPSNPPHNGIGRGPRRPGRSISMSAPSSTAAGRRPPISTRDHWSRWPEQQGMAGVVSARCTRVRLDSSRSGSRTFRGCDYYDSQYLRIFTASLGLITADCARISYMRWSYACKFPWDRLHVTGQSCP
jgi:hypothetical protein